MDLKSELKQSIWTRVSITDNAKIQEIIQKTFLRTWAITFTTFATWYYFVYLAKTWVIVESSLFRLFIASLIVSIWLIVIISFFRERMSYSTLAILWILFGIAEWIWLTWILLSYSGTSVVNAFAWAALLFLLMALYGYTTKKDLTKMWPILLIWLLAIIIMSLINIFIWSSMLDLWISIAWIIIFLGLVAFDLQMLKLVASNGDKRLEIVFWVSLYLDFINIFLFLLRMFGNRD